MRLRNNTTCTIKKELGRGGQGIVYLVDYKGGEYALKWYILEYGSAFYDNLERNVNKGAPSPSFLWPEAITERQFGSFGYLMKLRPKGYEEVGAFLLAKARFANVDIMIDACLQICTAFQQLHALGYSYQDMNDGNFFINPNTGHVLICDNDNVAPNGVNMGIAGKSGYMAPEIVEKETMPNRYTDYFSQSVILFLLFFMNRPFEGAKAISCPCLNESAERILNGKNCVFTCYGNNGMCYCAIEKAYREGRIDYYKPISCHLYPVRLTEYPTFTAVNYHRWKICKAAEALGRKENIRLYQFLKEPLIRRFGKEWYDELCEACEAYLEQYGE